MFRRIPSLSGTSYLRERETAMAKNWYPVVDYEKCNTCGYCIDLCQYDVYEKEKSPYPVIARPESCLEGCKYCGVMCAQNAIKFVEGDSEYKCDGDHFCSCCG
jgi:NAD-dependent dihydropyrimidine dehydrogenase PreA subunit